MADHLTMDQPLRSATPFDRETRDTPAGPVPPSSQPAQIRIDDLPPVEELTAEEMARLFGAGRVRLGFEQLESRDVLASSLTASLSGGLLRVEGTPGADVIRVFQTNDQIAIEGVAIQTGGAVAPSVSTSAVQRITIDALGGDDQVWVGNGSQPLTPSLEMWSSPGQDDLHTLGMTVAVGQAAGVEKVVQAGGKVFSLGRDGWVSVNGTKTLGGITQVVEAGGQAYALGSDSQLSAYDAATGTLRGLTYCVATAAAAHGKVYCLSTGGNLLSYTPFEGFKPVVESGVTQLVGADGEVYVLGVVSSVQGSGQLSVYSPGANGLTPLTADVIDVVAYNHMLFAQRRDGSVQRYDTANGGRGSRPTARWPPRPACSSAGAWPGPCPGAPPWPAPPSTTPPPALPGGAGCTSMPTTITA